MRASNKAGSMGRSYLLRVRADHQIGRTLASGWLREIRKQGNDNRRINGKARAAMRQYLESD